MDAFSPNMNKPLSFNDGTPVTPALTQQVFFVLFCLLMIGRRWQVLGVPEVQVRDLIFQN
jgi:hypothetical protein